MKCRMDQLVWEIAEEGNGDDPDIMVEYQISGHFLLLKESILEFKFLVIICDSNSFILYLI